MKKQLLTTLALAAVVAIPAAAETRRGAQAVPFASDSIIVPVMANNPGQQNAVFATHVSVMNPTSRAFNVNVSLYDGGGQRRDAVIPLAAGELKVYENFLGSVFSFAGAGTVKFKSSGGDNLFIVSSEVYTAGSQFRFGTSVPVLDFAGSDAHSFAAGITVSADQRTNVGCFNESDEPNTIHAIILDGAGRSLTTVDLNLPPHAWGQAGVSAQVTGGYVQFVKDGPADCYAVVVHNSANDGRFILGIEYEP